MSSRLYAIAYCDVAAQYYLLSLADDRRTVTDFMITTSQMKMKPPGRLSLATDRSLRPCIGCGSRAVAGCDCLRGRLPCEVRVGFRFHCIYCSRLRIVGVSP